MDISFIFKGLIIGFSIAAPVGAIGVLCIRRSLVKGSLSGFLTGLGAATADACYGAIAGFGITIISSFLLSYRVLLQTIGIVFLGYLGIKTFLEKPPVDILGTTQSRGLWMDYLSTVGLTITNPMTIISFTAVFAGLGVTNNWWDYVSASLLVLGVFLGSALWWLILSGGIWVFRSKLKTHIFLWVNRVSGMIILFFACLLLVELLVKKPFSF